MDTTAQTSIEQEPAPELPADREAALLNEEDDLPILSEDGLPVLVEARGSPC